MPKDVGAAHAAPKGVETELRVVVVVGTEGTGQDTGASCCWYTKRSREVVVVETGLGVVVVVGQWVAA